MKNILLKIDRLGGKLFFRAVSVIPITLLIVVTKNLVASFNQGAYVTLIVLLIPTVLLVVLIKYLWSSKRTVSDIVEANS